MDSVTTEVGADRGPTAVADPAALREVMARFATGVTVLSTGGEHIHGMTANAFTSVSLDPPAVLCCVGRSAVMHEAITAAGHFGVSIMEATQEDVVRFFADKHRPLGPEQFSRIDWTPGRHTGAPLLTGALAWLECDLSTAYSFGDHSIFVGQVVEARRGSGHDGLLFFDGTFQRAVARGA
ncbi:flavin reductase family protein [Streptomyces lancefieldiae]|uniref:Flavin reductase family protein n=1 Tax=Streptomyces lancefieldiae TaxID=3075520 RepID=A0ABU3AZW0_9ACTN|nr:flavin reductase family protein [Streptomyces sp. DSM 40712]MDT0615390.1 flavin reductase family protein [Streptomyces sp. DSM 40712]